jgi:hypothetical protein
MPRRKPTRRPGRTRRRSLTSRARRAIRWRARKAASTIRTHRARRRERKANQRTELQRIRAANPTGPRSLTGKPRTVPTTNRPPTTQTAPAGLAAPMTQRVKRTKGGRFNGSTGAAKKKTTAKKAAALTPAQKKAAATQRVLAASNARVNRIDKRTDATDTRIDRMFHTPPTKSTRKGS